MTINKFRLKAEKHLDKLRDLINTMPYESDSFGKPQKNVLKEELENLRDCFNRTEPRDLGE